MTYTDDDVQRLVNQCHDTLTWFTERYHTRSGSEMAIPLQNALKPFQPDPESELIEAMADAIRFVGAHDSNHPREYFIAYARAALNAQEEFHAQQNGTETD